MTKTCSLGALLFNIEHSLCFRSGFFPLGIQERTSQVPVLIEWGSQTINTISGSGKYHEEK